MTTAELLSLISTRVNDNTTGDITPDDLRVVLNSIAESIPSFAAVQQGGGFGQGNNKVYIGWGNAPDGNGNIRLKLTVDATDLGNFVLDTHLASAMSTKANANHTHNDIYFWDSRSVNSAPNYYGFKMIPEFKTSTVIGITGGEAFTGLITVAPWDGKTSGGGGKNYQMGFNGNKLYLRNGVDTTWGSWDTVVMNSEVTSNNTANTVVKRDGNGNFSASKIVAGSGFELLNHGTNGLYNGNGDNATRTTHNIILKGHNGMAFKTYDDSVTGLLDFRAGSLDLNGWITARSFVNDITSGEKHYKFNSGTEPLGFGMYGHADTLGFFDWQKSHSYLHFIRNTKAAHFGGDVNTVGDINIIKNHPWLTLDSSSTGSDTVEQAAGISVGEAGQKGNAAVHITYTGDGFSNVGMGTVTNAVPQYNVLKMHYLDNIARFQGNITSAGSITATGNVTSNSDARLKDNVVSLSGALDTVMSLDAKTYTRNDLDHKQEIGFIAQEVQQLLPSLVHQNGDTDILSLDYARLTAVLVNAVKELKKEIDDLKCQ
ncbi:tail fiber domain-containing protein [Rufibacter ruber]|uniref:tail fiber domain-containing protein n=1 Tax=Rufibacter ruber TaxID=1783499 RepID=UPI00083438F0|nr:tail fiber domain-containing protein [Rufibacter ruber]